MQGSARDGESVRHAADALRAAEGELPALAEQVDTRIRSVVEGVAAAAEQAEQAQSAHEIRLIGTRMTAAREDAFASASHVLTGYADEIEALLRPADGDRPAPVFSIRPLPRPAESVVTTAQETVVVQQHLPDAAAKRRAINQVVARFPPKLQALARTLLFGPSSHAVQRHGHHLRREHQIARAQWRLDPAGQDGWRLNPDGSADSWRTHGSGPHRVGPTSGQYTSPEAVAKPLITVLRAAGRTQSQLNAYLDAMAEGDTAVTIFLPTSATGITSADVLTVRAPGTDTESGETMWKRARRGSMAGHGDAPATRDYDMVINGSRPGSVIFFIKRNDWRLVTSYFMDDRGNEMTYTEL
jgi:hypothetical protein